MDISSATVRVAPDLLKAPAILSDTTVRRSAGSMTDAMTEGAELFTTLEESAPSKKDKEQAAVKQTSVSLKKVNQPEIVVAELNVMRDMSKGLNERLTSMNDEKQDDEDDLFGKLVAAELKSLP